MTRRNRLSDVLAGIDAAAEVGMRPVKLNAVLMRGRNDDEAVDLLAWAMERGHELRFIEQMPLDAGHTWTREGMITADEIQQRLSAAYELTPVPGRGAAPAERFYVDGGPAVVGIIASVTRPFCGACDRLRLTADGQLRSCLFARKESDLRTPLRAGATDEDLAEIIHSCLAAKLPGGIRPRIPATGSPDERDRGRRGRCPPPRDTLEADFWAARPLPDVGN